VPSATEIVYALALDDGSQIRPDTPPIGVACFVA
jgi:hypothetical protein